MNAVARDDRIAVSVVLSHGRVARLEISARRPVGVGKLVQGKPAELIVTLVPRLFALCAAAQRAAAILALAAARGETVPPNMLAAQAGAVLAERLIELLRGTITSLAADRISAFAPALRDLIAAATWFDGRNLLEIGAIDALADGLAVLGLQTDHVQDAETSRGWLTATFPLAPSSDFAAIAVDPLTADDDCAIGEQLLRHGAAFAARPDIAGRVPETGALARLADHPLLRSVGTGLTGRLLARLIEARETPQRLHALRRSDADPGDILRSVRLGDGVGLGAVECARGRLHHLIALDRDGRVARSEILAPTEWNFHRQGPLARALTGVPLRTAEADRQRVAALVAAFDPCVAYDVDLREAADA